VSENGSTNGAPSSNGAPQGSRPGFAGSAGEASSPKIGVYVCHCGINISDKVDVEELIAHAKTLPFVAVAREYKFMCSDPGQELIQQDLRDGLVDRVVVAACSPLMHEATFRRATEAGGLNPFLFQQANIREHVSWVTENGSIATDKAKALVSAAVRRVALHVPLERKHVPVHPDVLVVGGGIAGIQAALVLAEAGRKVHLVEREPSIGGHMAMLDKTFPTLDCAACILTPKMVQVGQHPNIDLLSYSEVEDVSGYVGNFKVTVRKKSRFVDEEVCNGCGLCIEACPFRDLPSEFDQGLGTRPCVYMQFPQAVPRLPVIDRQGTSPCTYSCPAGIAPHGYVSLIRAGEYEKAFQLVLESTPLVGTLGRACYAPCEDECARGCVEGTLPLRLLKRFVADVHYANGNGAGIEVAEPNGRSVAIVGSGPAGLTAAWQLRRLGYAVKILESAPEPGGMIRTAVPEYRLPAAVVEQDIANVTAIGVEIALNSRVEDLDALKREGYDAILVATGTPLSSRLGVPGEDAEGVVSDLDFLRSIRLGEPVDLRGKRVVIVGGGNTAMDAARTARRLGAKETIVAYRRSREEMPAHPEELEGAELEGVTFELLVQPVQVEVGEDGRVTGLTCVRNTLGEPDESGRRRPEPIPDSEFVLACDVVVQAIGIKPDVAALAPALPATRSGAIEADPETLQTAIPHVFAAGDVVLGPLDIANAVGHGRRAAFMIDRWLETGSLEGAAFGAKLPMVDKDAAIARLERKLQEPVRIGVPFAADPDDFHEIEAGLTEEQARYSVGRCLDCGPCSECGECVTACPLDCIDLHREEQLVAFDVGAVVMATGFKPFDARRIPLYGYGRLPNVVTSLEFERMVNAAGPTGGRPQLADGSSPQRVAIVHCVGSRNENYNRYCSTVCCMYSLKFAHLVKERTGAEVWNFYIDMRAAGKGYEDFYHRVMAEGTHFIRGRVAEVSDVPQVPEEEGRLVVTAEDTLNGVVRRVPVDMVILSVGMEPQADADEVRRKFSVSCSADGWFLEKHPKLAPISTVTDGIYLAGACQGPKDIPATVAQGQAAAGEVLALVDKGFVELEPNTAYIDEEACSGCRTCVALCPFNALSFSVERNIALLNEALCKGCGVCVAGCPSGALHQHLFDDEQILEEIQGVLAYA
jgi:heterodisulfide reductase subunit A2